MQFVANGIGTGAIYATVALGFALVYRTTGVFNIAHGALVAVGACAAVCVGRDLGMPLVVAVILSVSASAVVGGLLEWIVFRPLARCKASLTIAMVRRKMWVKNLRGKIEKWLGSCTAHGTRLHLKALEVVGDDGYKLNAHVVWNSEQEADER